MDLEAIWRLSRPHDSAQDDLETVPFFTWLRMQRAGSRVALYASSPSPASIFVHAVSVPAANLRRPWDELTEWNGSPFDAPTCSLVYGGNDGPRIERHEPWDDHEPEVLRGARQLVFGRSFDGRIGEKSYFELTQDITVAHGLHWLEERKAWCRLDDEGDIEEVAGVAEHRLSAADSATLVWINREVLEAYLASTATCLAQTFDCAWLPRFDTRFDPARIKHYTDEAKTLTCKFMIDADASCFRGVQFIAPARTVHELGELAYARSHPPKEYETFIIHDWKNDRIVEWSSAPGTLATYFQPDSTAPFGTSPVFFKPQVLDKYKADREKYSLSDRTLSCRNAWSLKTFDVNAAGQVHTYIIYLGNLPIAEQRYWKSFNEPPKAPIAQRAIASDFEGRWDTEPDGLRDLKGLLPRLHRESSLWFRLKQPELLDHLNYPLTSAHKPWDDAIIDLAKVVVEGLELAALKKLAKARGRIEDPKWGSIRWLREALIGVGVEEERAMELATPLDQLQRLRSKLSAHASGGDSAEIRRQLLKEFKTPKAHIEALATQLHASLTAISGILQASH